MCILKILKVEELFYSLGFIFYANDVWVQSKRTFIFKYKKWSVSYVYF